MFIQNLGDNISKNKSNGWGGKDFFNSYIHRVLKNLKLFKMHKILSNIQYIK